jgi:conjugal transfer pilus assembly protein TraF
MANLVCRLLLIVFVLLSNANVLANDSYFTDHAKGWHWYDDPKTEQDDEENTQSDPIVQMNAIRATINRAKDKMVLNPTKENVKNYISIQNQLSDNASHVSQTWREVLLENPELDFSLVHPTNNDAKQVENDLITQQENDAIHELAKKSGLFFFYRSTCPYCVKFAPILKDFAEKFGITIVPITTDGISLPEFPNSYSDKGQAVKFDVKVEPALFVVNPYTHQAVPVSYGLTSVADLKKRILDIAKHQKGNIT